MQERRGLFRLFHAKLGVMPTAPREFPADQFILVIAQAGAFVLRPIEGYHKAGRA